MTTTLYPPSANVPTKQLQHRVRILDRLRRKGIEPNCIEDIPDDDAKTWKLINDGETDGIFGLEPVIFGKTLARMKPETLDDLAAMITLNRSNEFVQNLFDEYVARANGKEWTTNGDMDMDATFALAIYREDALYHGLPGDQAKQLFDKSSALGWAWFAWTMAYLKANFRDDFDMAVTQHNHAMKVYNLCRDSYCHGLLRIADEQFLILGYGWRFPVICSNPALGLAGMNTQGGLVMFVCRTADTLDDPAAATRVGLDRLSWQTSASNFESLQGHFDKLRPERRAVVDQHFPHVVPNLKAQHEVVVLATNDYFQRSIGQTDSDHGQCIVMRTDDGIDCTVRIRFAETDFSSAQGEWLP